MLFRRPNPLAPKPAPLTEAECERIWRWERWMIGLCLLGVLLIAAALGLGHALGGGMVVQRFVVGAFVVLALAGLVAPLREKCPRCRKRLTVAWRFTLPENCRGCGVAFPRRPRRVTLR